MSNEATDPRLYKSAGCFSSYKRYVEFATQEDMLVMNHYEWRRSRVRTTKLLREGRIAYEQSQHFEIGKLRG